MTILHYPYTVVIREDGKVVQSNIKELPEGKWLNSIELLEIEATVKQAAETQPRERKFLKPKINRLR